MVLCSKSEWPVGHGDCDKQLSCSQIGWLAGSSGVCGSSELQGTLDESSDDMCIREASKHEAVEMCEDRGSRLCTAPELLDGVANPSACGFESQWTWLWAEDPQDECSGDESSLAVSGSPGAWFSFSSTNVGYYEVQLITLGAGAAFSMTIHGRDTQVIPTTVASNETDSVAVGWNATRRGEVFFAHVTGNDLDAEFYPVIAVTPSASNSTVAGAAPSLMARPPCEKSHSLALDAESEVFDVCGDVTAIVACGGVLSDGVGPVIDVGIACMRSAIRSL